MPVEVGIASCIGVKSLDIASTHLGKIPRIMNRQIYKGVGYAMSTLAKYYWGRSRKEP